LFVQVLKDLGKRRGIDKIQLPFIEKQNLKYIKGFIEDGGLSELKDKNKWMFMINIDTSSKFSSQNLEQKKIRKELLGKGISIIKIRDKKLTFTPFVFSNDFNRAAFIFEELFFPGDNTAVRLNTIICFYYYADGSWRQEFSYPVVLE